MIGEYGYMEEGKLGKPYDLGLIRRLIRYAFPYRAMILFALLLTVLITLMDLALPSLSKIAIDRYILATWHRVSLASLEEPVRKQITEALGQALQKDKDGSAAFVSRENLKKLDPALLYKLRSRGLIAEKGYCRIPAPQEGGFFKEEQGDFLLQDGAWMVPFESVGGFPEEYSGSQDIAFSWRVQLLTGTPVHFVPEAEYLYRHRKSLLGMYRQSRNWGFSNVLLYREFRGQGMPGKNVRSAFWDWKDVLKRLMKTRSKTELAIQLVRLGYCVGRLDGSVRYKVLYL